jgi:peptidyl-prolyl cis-trans isomerase C/peptidyl-prolyl cis-trans isomerase D
MNKINLWILPLTILTLSSANAATEVAKVNDKVITLEQVNARIAEQARSGSPIALTKKAAVDELVKREAAIQEAKKMKLDQDPTIAERINNVLYFAILEKKLGNEFEKITLSDAEAKNWYEKNPEIRTSHIFVALPQDANQEEEKKAAAKLNSLLGEIRAGKISFAEAAQKNSEDPSAAMGGDLDYRMKDRLDTSFYRAALKLGKSGDISGVVKTPFGLHLIRLTGKHNWSEVDRQHVKRLILDDKRQEIVSHFLDGLRQKAKVSVNSGAIKE